MLVELSFRTGSPVVPSPPSSFLRRKNYLSIASLLCLLADVRSSRLRRTKGKIRSDFFTCFFFLLFDYTFPIAFTFFSFFFVFNFGFKSLKMAVLARRAQRLFSRFTCRASRFC